MRKRIGHSDLILDRGQIDKADGAFAAGPEMKVPAHISESSTRSGPFEHGYDDINPKDERKSITHECDAPAWAANRFL